MAEMDEPDAPSEPSSTEPEEEAARYSCDASPSRACGGAMPGQEQHEADDEEAVPTQEQLEQRRAANIQALVSGRLETGRAPILSKYLQLTQGEQVRGPGC